MSMPLQDPKECSYIDALNCNAYYQCVDNVIVHKFCPNGMNWNSEMNNCDPKILCQNVTSLSFKTEDNLPHPPEDASDRKPPTKPPIKPPTKPPVITTIRTTVRPVITTTKRYTSTTVASSKYICPNQNGRFYPHPNCNHFYEAMGDLLIDRLCPGNRRWNEQENCCDYSETTQCVYNESLYRPDAISENNIPSSSQQFKLNFMMIVVQILVVVKLCVSNSKFFLTK